MKKLFIALDGISVKEWTALKNEVDMIFSQKKRELDKNIKLSKDDYGILIRSLNAKND